ncbi:MAG: WG repeat-containing protein [Deltaproteobacteria bacterium]
MRRMLLVVLVLSACSLAWLAARGSGADEHLDWLVPPEYDATYHFSEGYGIAERGKQLFLADLQGILRPIDGYRLAVSHRGKGSFDVIGDNLYVSQHRFALVSIQDNKWHYFVAQTLRTLPGAWDEGAPFSEGKACVNEGRRYYVIDLQGKRLFALPGDPGPSGYSQGYLAVSNDEDKWGYVNTEGDWAIPPKYEWVLAFSDDVAWVLEDDAAFAIDREGHEIPDSRHEGNLAWCKGRTALFETETGWLLYNCSRGLLATGKGDTMADTHMDAPLAVESPDGLWMYIDAEGRQAFKGSFNSWAPFHNGYGVFSEGNRVGVIDSRGRVVVPPVLDWSQFSRAGNGVLNARYKGKEGFLKLKKE